MPGLSTEEYLNFLASGGWNINPRTGQVSRTSGGPGGIRPMSGITPSSANAMQALNEWQSGVRPVPSPVTGLDPSGNYQIDPNLPPWAAPSPLSGGGPAYTGGDAMNPLMVSGPTTGAPPLTNYGSPGAGGGGPAHTPQQLALEQQTRDSFAQYQQQVHQNALNHYGPQWFSQGIIGGGSWNPGGSSAPTTTTGSVPPALPGSTGAGSIPSLNPTLSQSAVGPGGPGAMMYSGLSASGPGQLYGLVGRRK